MIAAVYHISVHLRHEISSSSTFCMSKGEQGAPEGKMTLRSFVRNKLGQQFHIVAAVDATGVINFINKGCIYVF